MTKPIPELVDNFVKHMQAQTEAIARGDVVASNKHADQYFAAWDALKGEYGDAGRDGLAVLLRHPRSDVRGIAAALLLRHKTEEATRVLEEAVADGNYGAKLTLERWRNGTWELDPAPGPAAPTRTGE